AGVLKNMGHVHSAVVCGAGNMDEITLSGPTKVSELKKGEISTYYIKPGDFGLAEAPMEAVKGGNPEKNAAILRAVFSGTEKGAYRNVIILNSGFALYIADNVAAPAEGVKKSAEIIDSGLALKKLEDFIRCSNG
ncbi:MAG TPA: anthranilate phosphoribosyltransferase, partial [Candidatus Goldiibacteriota bacterium]|nr:anthranilate phosphoribosyltransferase [Candidatus Goldiibacteriota bacterium]